MYDKIRHIIAYMLCYMVCLSSVYGHSDYDVSNDADPVVTILFIAFGLGIGILIQQVLSKLGDPVPYTVVVFIAGLVFSSWNREDAGMYVGHRLCVIFYCYCHYSASTHCIVEYCYVLSSRLHIYHVCLCRGHGHLGQHMGQYRPHSSPLRVPPPSHLRGGHVAQLAPRTGWFPPVAAASWTWSGHRYV